MPAATVVEDCMVTVPTARPAFKIAACAAACVSATTLGTPRGWRQIQFRDAAVRHGRLRQAHRLQRECGPY